MEMGSDVQFKLATNFLPLVEAAKGNIEQLRHLLSLCEVANKFATDDYSITYSLTEYVQECLAVAEGHGDQEWCDELLDALRTDIDALAEA